jgi:hypothetical protein
MQLSFGLGKANDDLKDYNRAFDYFAEGNAIRRKGINYDPVRTRAEFEAMKTVFDAGFFEKHRPSPITDDAPIFHRRHAAFGHDAGRADHRQPSQGLWCGRAQHPEEGGRQAVPGDHAGRLSLGRCIKARLKPLLDKLG